MSLTRDQFVSTLESIYYGQINNGVQTLIYLHTNDAANMDTFLTGYLRAQGRINFYLAEWDAAPDQPSKDAVVGSVDGILGTATVNPDAAVLWADSGGRWGDTRGPSGATSGSLVSYASTTGKLLNATTQVQSDWNETNTSAADYIKNKPTITTRSQSAATRSLNSAFQVNATRDSLVSYCVDISTSITLTTGQSGTIFLEIASDSGFTTNVQQIGQFTNSNTGTLTIGLALNQIGTAGLTGYVPASYYVRLRTVNNTGTPTFTYRSGQEVLL